MVPSDTSQFLRKIPLFSDLPEPYLDEICRQSSEIRLAAGDLLFSEGDAGQHAYIIREGQVGIYKESSGLPILLAVRQAGDVIGEMALIESAPRNATIRALSDSLLLAIGSDAFIHLLDTYPFVARKLLHTVTHRLQSSELLLRQSEKMAQLGVLTAGITHELNNPAAAVQRGSEQIRFNLLDLLRTTLEIGALELTPEQFQTLLSMETDWQASAQTALKFDPLERSDREEEIEHWLESRVEGGWKYASGLVEMGYTPASLEALVKMFPSQSHGLLLRWTIGCFTVLRLLDEINLGSGRMSEIVKALKSYVFLDQGPIQEVDIHEALENTLIILRFKLKQGILVRREFDPALPRIEAHGSELNQVWTNIIDNAIDAMDGKGELLLRTSYRDPWIVVEICDNGPGIPAEIQSKIFYPFFTTKAVGTGTGLGLNTSYNIIRKHNGDIRVYSRPQETRFEVWLPLSPRFDTAESLPPQSPGSVTS